VSPRYENTAAAITQRVNYPIANLFWDEARRRNEPEADQEDANVREREG
jgi:hypothetical protein